MNHLGGVSCDLSAAAKRQPREEVTRIRYAAGKGTPPPLPPLPRSLKVIGRADAFVFAYKQDKLPTKGR